LSPSLAREATPPVERLQMLARSGADKWLL
jgi:hypothetical protein